MNFPLACKNLFFCIAFWIRNARFRTWKQSVVPGLLTLFLVWGEPGFSLVSGLAAVAGVLLAHLGANLLDDYFDFRSGCVESRQKMINGGMRARARKCSYLLNDQTTTRTLLAAGTIFCVLATVIGCVLWRWRGEPILYCAVTAGFLALFYSAPPLRLSFHGLGELTVSLLFGPILMIGTAWSACGHLVPGVLPLSCSVGLLVGNILYTHSILDLDPDRRAGKRTLAVLCGHSRLAVVLSGILLLAIYLPVLLGVWYGVLPGMALLVFLSVPVAIELWWLLWLHVVRPDRPVRRTVWMGPMENWSAIEQYHLDWFMIRWYLARNLMALFCLLLVAAFCLESVIL